MRRHAQEAPALEYEVVRDIEALGARVWDVLVIRGEEVWLYRKYQNVEGGAGVVWPGDRITAHADGTAELLRFYAGNAIALVGLYHQHLKPFGHSLQLWTLLVERSGVLPRPGLHVSSNPDPKPSRRRKVPVLRLVRGGA